MPCIIIVNNNAIIIIENTGFQTFQLKPPFDWYSRSSDIQIRHCDLLRLYIQEILQLITHLRTNMMMIHVYDTNGTLMTCCDVNKHGYHVVYHDKFTPALDPSQGCRTSPLSSPLVRVSKNIILKCFSERGTEERGGQFSAMDTSWSPGDGAEIYKMLS